MTERRQVAATFTILTAVLLLAYTGPLFQGVTFALRDHMTVFLPSRHHLAEALAAGRFPEWWDAVGLGAPFAANPLHGTCYPPAWIVAALGGDLGADVLVVMHLVWAAWGGALLARRLGAGLAG